MSQIFQPFHVSNLRQASTVLYQFLAVFIEIYETQRCAQNIVLHASPIAISFSFRFPSTHFKRKYDLCVFSVFFGVLS